MFKASFLLLALFCGFSAQPLYPQSEDFSLASHRAAQFMAAGNYEQAAQIYQTLTRALPRNPGLAFDLGLALHMLRREREATHFLNQ